MSVKEDFPHSEILDGIRFRCANLRPKRARRLFVRAGPLLGASAGSFSNVSPDDLDLMFADAEEVTQYSTDGGAKWPYLSAPNQEHLFHGRTLLSFKFLAWFLKAQFSDFVASPTSPLDGADRSDAAPGS